MRGRDNNRVNGYTIAYIALIILLIISIYWPIIKDIMS